MFHPKFKIAKVSFIAMCIFLSIVLIQAIHKTFFNFLQKPYAYFKQDARSFTDENMLQLMLQNEKNKNFALQKQLALNNECRKILSLTSASYQEVAVGVSIFFSKGNSKFIIAMMNNNNVKINDIAINANNYLIGRVIDIFGNGMLKIQQIEDGKAYIPSIILQHSLTGYVNGYSGVGCDVIFDADGTFDVSNINDDDIVLTSGFNDFIPYGINIGRIKKQKGKLCINRDINTRGNIVKIVRARADFQK